MPDKKHIDSDPNLFKDYDPASTDQWESYISDELGGKSYKDQLRWVPDEGFEVLPFYRKESRDKLPYIDSLPGTPPFIRGCSSGHSWSPAEFIMQPEPFKANLQARRAIEDGMTKIHFLCSMTVYPDRPGGVIRGVRIQSQDDFNILLSGLDLKKTEFVFESGMASPAIFAMFLNLLQKEAVPADEAAARFLFDPWAYSAEEGILFQENRFVHDIMHKLSNQHGSAGTDIQFLSANGHFFRQCGATLVQELGIALSAGSEYLASAAHRPEAAASFWMQLSAGSLFFPEIAKFRAARLLWSRVTEAYGLGMEAAETLHIHAVTSPFTKTVSDGFNNIFRLATESMAAITGGADSLTILPFDLTWQPPGMFSSHISRNIHHILKHESYFDRVSDPAGGSYYVEELTDIIAKEAWEQFRIIEKQGGIRKALENGLLQAGVEKSAGKRREAVERGDIQITGVNYTPDTGIIPNDFSVRTVRSDCKRSESVSQKGLVASAADPESFRNLFLNGGTVGDTAQLFRLQGTRNISALTSTRLALSAEKNLQKRSHTRRP